MPLHWDKAEILCDEPGCPSFVLGSYSARGVHTYPQACLYRNAQTALHVVGDLFHIARTDGSELEFPFGFVRSILRLDNEVRWVGGNGHALSLRESSPEAASAFAQSLARIAHPSRLSDIEESALIATPEQSHGRLVRFTTLWSLGFERSAAAGAWVTTNDDVEVPAQRGAQPVRISGLWLSQPRKVYGHLGGYSAELLAYAIEPLARGSHA